ncbi:response regulator [bacterium M00.F.Ca.ET.194.01.1.1]|nr:response regulator [bacterium M00.F.Ca.ET.194.01.1.1]TGS52464.1 response regulator [bacterium M00.F.Ca.ET.179.01.1.1]TGV44320.1 response regulator [bacterium M00.F.Ca.ET.168.01.1.1]
MMITPERKLRIFIVEDEALVAMLMEDIVTDLGHEVSTIASRVQQGCEIARGGDFDVAILDINLDGQTSYPIAEILREQRIPFAFASGYGAKGLDRSYADVPTLSKPYVIEDVERLIARLIR